MAVDVEVRGFVVHSSLSTNDRRGGELSISHSSYGLTERASFPDNSGLVTQG